MLEWALIFNKRRKNLAYPLIRKKSYCALKMLEMEKDGKIKDLEEEDRSAAAMAQNK